MKTFQDIQEGDILLKKGGVVRGIDGNIIFQEWVELKVEKVTKVFYTVNGEKYRKSDNGKQFMNHFYFPGQGSAPECATKPGELGRILDLIKEIRGLDFIGRTGIEKIKDLCVAAELGKELRSVLKRIEDASNV